jgi:thymidylate synthase ThyX
MSLNYQDGGHRPHARHDGETPKNPIVEAPYHLSVTLDTWGPVDNLFPSLYDALQANWGDAPSRVSDMLDLYEAGGRYQDIHCRTGWESLTPDRRAYVESCFAGKTLPQVLERISFSFLVEGCTRACTHQLVRSRIGAAFMQHGGRDNDWRHRPWVMPETIRRACRAQEVGVLAERFSSCIVDWGPIEAYLGRTPHFDGFPWNGTDPTLRGAIEQYLDNGRRLYAALVDAGIPWEDARRLLWMGTSTYIHCDYNYLALQGVMARRLEHVMDWEINCVAQLMKREVAMKCPPLFAKYLRSASDIKGQAAFAGLQSWPPDGKYPNPYERCKNCGHAPGNHKKGGSDPDVCEVCSRTNNSCPDYIPEDSLPREHRPEQNPFWVLYPESMAGGPIRWIPTNGTYPHEEVK